MGLSPIIFILRQSEKTTNVNSNAEVCEKSNYIIDHSMHRQTSYSKWSKKDKNHINIWEEVETNFGPIW